MVGLIHRILFDLLEQLLDQQSIESICNRAGIAHDTEFRIDTRYSDEQFRKLLGAVMSETGMGQATRGKHCASQFLKDCKTRWPTWFQIPPTAREFFIRQPKISEGSCLKKGDEECCTTIEWPTSG